MASSSRPHPRRGEGLGAYLKRSRQAAGLSQDELVRRTGLALSTVRKVEDGRTPNPGIFTLLALWQELDLPLEGLAEVRAPERSVDRKHSR